MPRPAPQWKSKMPEFLGAIACATSEDDIRRACEEIRQSVADCYLHAPSSRERPMGEIREAIRGRYPVKNQESEFYYFTESGQGHKPRWEHLAIKYLPGWNKKEDRSFEQNSSNSEERPEKQVEEEVVKEVKPELDILKEVGLTSDEINAVQQALGDADIKGWVKQAIMQRANAINNKKSAMDEDLTEVPSEVLMSDKKYRTNPSAARELTSRAVRVVKEWNHDHPDQKWCITNKLIGELTGVTVKAIAKAVEGMDLKTYNEGLEPIANRLLKAEIGEPAKVMSIAKVTGVEGTEGNYNP